MNTRTDTAVTGERTVARIEWKQVPSVTTGGKAFFYNTITDDYYAHRSVVWDRFAKVWVVKGPQTKEDYNGKAYCTFDSVREAKQYVEQGKAI